MSGLLTITLRSRMRLLSYGMVLSGGFALMAPNEAMAEQRPVTRECILKTADAFHVPYRIILTLLRTEGGRLGMEHRNNNGTYDLGPMQVNSRWMPEIARMHFSGNQREAWDAVRDWGCYNILVGTWVFRGYVDEANGNLAEAVGLYNSHSPKPKMAYQHKFASRYAELFFNKVGVQDKLRSDSFAQGQHG